MLPGSLVFIVLHFVNVFPKILS